MDEPSDLNLNSSNNNVYDLVEEDTKRTGRGANKDMAIEMDMIRKNSKSEDINPSSTAQKNHPTVIKKPVDIKNSSERS